ncbi:hypothetical protein LA303_07845 [Candidatus Sulfidibacterium hydrothermale]|uniref:hypothetical protein n=1 Tax=Candidatus Sulfidibacterium hydrothermale TaxID=2875962 RepID=UPI001F0AAC99|nr:hypothetical protein [Candidatus Sulfidibacterium hydrothermale]UBM61335.1 hypothetical protein LA303_07845 [Candidatus Sulfidibacterium hydrothermale]
MRLSLTLILTTFIITVGFSQEQDFTHKIKSFEWGISLAYLPSPYSEAEYYKFKSNRLKHKYSKTKRFLGIMLNTKKLFTTKNKEKVLRSINVFMQYQNRNIIQVGLSKQEKDSLIVMAKRLDYQGLPMYSVDSNDLMKYISKKDTIDIDISEFNTEYSKSLDASTIVVDGIPFRISLKIITKTNDTLRFQYYGNLYDGIKDTDVDNFLTYYFIYQHFQLFKYTSMENYFNEKNLFEVILRYIAYKENKVDRVDDLKFKNE